MKEPSAADTESTRFPAIPFIRKPLHALAQVRCSCLLWHRHGTFGTEDSEDVTDRACQDFDVPGKDPERVVNADGKEPSKRGLELFKR